MAITIKRCPKCGELGIIGEGQENCFFCWISETPERRAKLKGEIKNCHRCGHLSIIPRGQKICVFCFIKEEEK